jgi:hypothetical protein
VRALQHRDQAEVGEADGTVVHHQDVVRLEVSVHPAGGVQVGQPLTDLGEVPANSGWAGLSTEVTSTARISRSLSSR